MGSPRRVERPTLAGLRREVRAATDLKRGAFLERFFKTGKGGYAEGDRFLGLSVPTSRAIAARFAGLPERDVKTLLASKWHDERFIGLLLLVERYKTGDTKGRAATVRFYLSQLDCVNNWDLVDTSAYAILGEWLVERPRAVLTRLAKSKDLWRRRVAIVSTWAFIRRGECAETFRIADLLLHDRHDLIHKATGWMLREAGKRCGKAKLVAWLAPRYRTMPRTMLRYAIERFPAAERRRYLSGKV